MDELRRPVWVAFPRTPWGSIGWRMGSGEVYWHDWMDWFRGLQEQERAAFATRWPEPEGWQGFYAYIETGQRPAWRQLKRERT